MAQLLLYDRHRAGLGVQQLNTQNQANEISAMPLECGRTANGQGGGSLLGVNTNVLKLDR